jgi:ribosomal protein S18 acetylase RimI-like enzyme
LLVCEAEEALEKLGWRKISLQTRAENDQVSAFYRRLGYVAEARISMGKLLKP